MKEVSQYYFICLTAYERKKFTGIVIHKGPEGEIIGKTYYKNGIIHNDAGPAVITISYNNNIYYTYYINGKEINFQAFCLYKDLLSLKGLT